MNMRTRCAGGGDKVRGCDIPQEIRGSGKGKGAGPTGKGVCVAMGR